MFIRYRHGSSANPGTWIYDEVTGLDDLAEEDLDDEIQEMFTDHRLTGNPLYHGIKWERVETPPHEFIVKRAQSHARKADYHTRQAARYTTWLETGQDPS